MFYKRKYLLAYYNIKDELLFVADNIQDFKKQYSNFRKHFTASACPADTVNHLIKSERIKLIDVFAQKNDIFLQEDLEFKKFIQNNNLNKTISQIAQENNINIRTFYRKRNLWKNKDEITKQ